MKSSKGLTSVNILLFCLFLVGHMTITTANAVEDGRKKVLYVNSYDLDNIWAYGVIQGALKVFNITMDENHVLDDSHSPIHFRLFNMDTKNNKSEKAKKEAARKAKELIDSWQPDVVICVDDNASKYLIVPYFLNSDLPFVFCGVNWDASGYGFPASNVTGMLEVFPVQEMLDILTPHVEGRRIGFLSNDSLTERKNAKYIRELFKLDMNARFIENMDEMEATFKALQEESDMVMIIDVVSIKGYDLDRMVEIYDTYTFKPTFSFSSRQEHMNHLLIGKRIPQEQGEWAAVASLEILDGKSPMDIPVTMNRKAAVRLNMRLAKKLGIKFPMEVIERAAFVSEE